MIVSLNLNEYRMRTVSYRSNIRVYAGRSNKNRRLCYQLFFTKEVNTQC